MNLAVPRPRPSLVPSSASLSLSSSLSLSLPSPLSAFCCLEAGFVPDAMPAFTPTGAVYLSFSPQTVEGVVAGDLVPASEPHVYRREDSASWSQGLLTDPRVPDIYRTVQANAQGAWEAIYGGDQPRSTRPSVLPRCRLPPRPSTAVASSPPAVPPACRRWLQHPHHAHDLHDFQGCSHPASH